MATLKGLVRLAIFDETGTPPMVCTICAHLRSEHVVAYDDKDHTSAVYCDSTGCKCQWSEPWPR